MLRCCGQVESPGITLKDPKCIETVLIAHKSRRAAFGFIKAHQRCRENLVLTLVEHLLQLDPTVWVFVKPNGAKQFIENEVKQYEVLSVGDCIKSVDETDRSWILPPGSSCTAVSIA